MAKCKNTILNEMVENTAEVMLGKIEYLEIVRDQFEKKDDKARVANLNADIAEMRAAVATIHKFSGCWA